MKQMKTGCATEEGVGRPSGSLGAYSKIARFWNQSCGPAKRFGESMGSTQVNLWWPSLEGEKEVGMKLGPVNCSNGLDLGFIIHEKRSCPKPLLLKVS